MVSEKIFSSDTKLLGFFCMVRNFPRIGMTTDNGWSLWWLIYCIFLPPFEIRFLFFYFYKKGKNNKWIIYEFHKHFPFLCFESHNRKYENRKKGKIARAKTFSRWRGGRSGRERDHSRYEVALRGASATLVLTVCVTRIPQRVPVSKNVIFRVFPFSFILCFSKGFKKNYHVMLVRIIYKDFHVFPWDTSRITQFSFF